MGSACAGYSQYWTRSASRYAPSAKPQILCTDLDGTLLNSHHAVSEANAKAISKAHAAGYTIVLCSGRGPTTYMPTARELGIPGGIHLVGYNGALVCRLDQDGVIERIIFEAKMSQDQVRKVEVLADAEGLAIEMDIGFIQLARCENEEQRELLDEHAKLVRSKPQVVPSFSGSAAPHKMTVFTRDPAAFVQRAKAQAGFENDGVGVVQGGPFWVETVALRHDKASGVGLLCTELGASLDDCIYFGDSANDATSLQAVGLGIAMSQATPEAVNAADKLSYYCNDEDAVAKEIDLILTRTTESVVSPITQEEVLPPPRGVTSRALSVHYFKTAFMKDVYAKGYSHTSSVRKVARDVIFTKGQDVWCERHKMQGSSYVDAVDGSDNVGRATHMLSYTWGYSVGDIVDTLATYCGQKGADPKRTYVWVCCVCINQHYVDACKKVGHEVSYNDLSEAFEKSITSAGRVLALLAPWRAPENLTRVWCIFEIHKCISLSKRNVELEFVMPPAQMNDFMTCICDASKPTHFEDLWTALAAVDIQQATAYSKQDKEQIMAECKKFGIADLNNAVRSHLQVWFANTAKAEVLEKDISGLSAVVACHRAGKMLSDLNNFANAKCVLEKGERMSLGVGPLSDLASHCLLVTETGGIFHEHGWVLHREKLYKDARVKYRSGLELIGEVRKKMESGDRHDTEEVKMALRKLDLMEAKLLRGDARAIVGDDPFGVVDPSDLCNALESYRRSLDHMLQHDKYSVDTGKVYTNLGLCCTLQGEYKTAKQYFDDGKHIYSQLNQLSLPPNMTRLYNLGCMLKKSKDAAQAKSKLLEAREIAAVFSNQKMLSAIDKAMDGLQSN